MTFNGLEGVTKNWMTRMTKNFGFKFVPKKIKGKKGLTSRLSSFTSVRFWLNRAFQSTTLKCTGWTRILSMSGEC